VLSEVLAGGRTGLLYKEMVRDKQIALAAESQSTFPSGRYPSLFLFFSVPSQGHTIDDNEKAIYEIIERVKREKPDEATIKRIKTRLRAELIKKLDSNSGLAAELCSYSANYGDWKKLFTELDDYNRVTADDVQKAAQKYLVPEHRTVAYTYAPKEAGAK
jgi:predicted Zn-dependent peptidase